MQQDATMFWQYAYRYKEKEFTDFHDYIPGIQKKKADCADKQKKSVVLATPCAQISFILTVAELDGLCRMTDYVDTEIKTAELIEMFAA